MPDRADLITLTDAIATYGHARAWWYAQVKAGELTFYDFPGDRNVYLSRSQVEAYLNTPRTRGRPVEGKGESETA